MTFVRSNLHRERERYLYGTYFGGGPSFIMMSFSPMSGTVINWIPSAESWPGLVRDHTREDRPPTPEPERPAGPDDDISDEGRPFYMSRELWVSIQRSRKGRVANR